MQYIGKICRGMTRHIWFEFQRRFPGVTKLLKTGRAERRMRSIGCIGSAGIFIALFMILLFSIRLLSEQSKENSELRYFWLTVICCFFLIGKISWKKTFSSKDHRSSVSEYIFICCRIHSQINRQRWIGL